jgi:NAD-dependent dihydropyrimidine dehydrogenase PreA subunit
VNRAGKEQRPGLFAPAIDRARCEGGFHRACASAKCPCVPACPHSVLEIRPLTAEDKRRLSPGGRLRAWIHGNRQAYVAKAEGCTACARCVQACPVPGVIKLRRRSSV